MNKKANDNKKNKEPLFDVAVIGAGPAGIMAAGTAASLGASVILIEKNNYLGKKLLLTGKGRCNLTKAEQNMKIFADSFGKQGRFLLSALSVFGVKQTIDFFEKRGVKTKIERGKRVFPKSNKSKDVLDAIENYLKQGRVVVLKGKKVKALQKKANKVAKIILENGKSITAKNYIICAGGKSYPNTGSTGDGYNFAKKLGHNIILPKPGLTSLIIKENWAKKAQGLALKNVKISVYQNNKKKYDKLGEMLFTHFGLSGPIILSASKIIGELLEKGSVLLELDLKPGLDEKGLDKRIKKDFQEYKNRAFKNCLNDLLPKKIIPVILSLSKIDLEKKANGLTKQERKELIRLLKALKMNVLELSGFNQAIITRGGIDLKEIDNKTMKSKIIDNLYFAGEIIDLDGPTGGYNLQLCWTTGFTAGKSAAKALK